MILNTREKKDCFISNFSTFIFDCDGVLWSGNIATEGVYETLKMLQNLNKRILFISNNSTTSRINYKAKILKRIGIDVDKNDIFSSAYLTAKWLKNYGFGKKKAYVIGMKGLVEELREIGMQCNDHNLHDTKVYNELEFIEEFKIDESIGAVIVGYTNRFNNYKIAYGSLCVRMIKNCLFIATNDDETFPLVKKNGERIMVPGGGSYVAALKTASLRDPDIIIGKPNVYGIETVIKQFSLDKEKICYVGDRLNTDIKMSNLAGIKSLLVVKTGVTTLEDFHKLEKEKDENVRSSLMPTYVIDKIGDL